MSSVPFQEGMIGDAKRFARGWALAKSRCLAGDRRPSKVLMLAGGAPEEEARALRHLWPGCQVVAVDRDAECAEKARACADAARVGNVEDLDEEGFCLVDLDFCTTVSSNVDAVRECARRMVRPGGALQVTFRYGRDDADRYAELADTGDGKRLAAMLSISDRAMENAPALAGRILACKPSSFSLEGVVRYAGANGAAMCVVVMKQWTFTAGISSGLEVVKASSALLGLP